MEMAEEQLACPLTKGEKILVAVDGSIYSNVALDQAISMATVCGSELFAIHVVEAYPKHLESAPAFEEEIRKAGTKFLEEVKDTATQKNVSCETILKVGGQPYEFIVKEAKSRGIDLIVVGTHGRSGLKRLFMGSVAQKVIGHTPCAVLVVPAFPS